MNIDFVRTAEKAKILNLSEVGRKCDVSRQTVVEVIKGVYPSMHTDRARKVIDMLREFGVLVEVPASDVDLAA